MKQIGVLEVDIKYLYVSFATPVFASTCMIAVKGEMVKCHITEGEER
jgi:hypothetical protein